MIAFIRQWLACRKLNRVTAKSRAKFAAEHPDFDRRRKAALRHVPRAWAS